MNSQAPETIGMVHIYLVTLSQMVAQRLWQLSHYQRVAGSIAAHYRPSWAPERFPT